MRERCARDGEVNKRRERVLLKGGFMTCVVCSRVCVKGRDVCVYPHHLGGPREGSKRGVEVVHGVAHLVEGQTLGLPQLSRLLVERLLLEEERDVVAAVEEVLVRRSGDIH